VPAVSPAPTLPPAPSRSRRTNGRLTEVLRRAAALDGRPIRVRLAPGVAGSGRPLISGGRAKVPVHAGRFCGRGRSCWSRHCWISRVEFAAHLPARAVSLRLAARRQSASGVPGKALLEDELRQRRAWGAGMVGGWQERRLGPRDRASRSRRWRDTPVRASAIPRPVCWAERRPRRFTLARRVRGEPPPLVQSLLGRPARGV